MKTLCYLLMLIPTSNIAFDEGRWIVHHPILPAPTGYDRAGRESYKRGWEYEARKLQTEEEINGANGP